MNKGFPKSGWEGPIDKENKTDARKKADTLVEKAELGTRMWQVGRIGELTRFYEPDMDLDQKIKVVNALDNMHKAIDTTYKQILEITKSDQPPEKLTQDNQIPSVEMSATDRKYIISKLDRIIEDSGTVLEDLNSDKPDLKNAKFLLEQVLAQARNSQEKLK